MDAAREGDCARPAVAGSWLDRDARLDRECKRALGEALAAEEERLRSRAAAADERLAELDAEMHLALARGREDRARAAVLQIISERRRGRALAGAIARLRHERARLATALASERAARSRRPARADSPPTLSASTPPRGSARLGSASSRSPASPRDSRGWI